MYVFRKYEKKANWLCASDSHAINISLLYYFFAPTKLRCGSIHHEKTHRRTSHPHQRGEKEMKTKNKKNT